MNSKLIIKTTCFLILLTPLIISAGIFVLHGIPDGLIDGDGALIGLMTDSASRFKHLIGLSSRTGVNHPGPLYFYLLSPLYRITNYRSFSLDLTVTLLNLLFIGGMLLLVQQQCKNLFIILWFTLLVTLYIRYLGPISTNFWTPCATIWSFWYGALCFTVIAQGTIAYLPIATVVMSFAVQTHFGYAPAFGVTAILSLLFWSYSRLKKAPNESSNISGRNFHILVASLLIFIILWAPPLIEQFLPNGGNLTKMVAFFQTQEASRSWQETYLLCSKIFSNYFLSWFISVNPWQQFAVHEIIAQIIFWGQICLLCVAGYITHVLRQSFLKVLALFVIFWHVILIISVQRITGIVFDYLVIWMGGIGVLSWFVIGASFLGLIKKIYPFNASIITVYIKKICLILLFLVCSSVSLNSSSILHKNTLYALKNRDFMTATPDFREVVDLTFQTIEQYQVDSYMVTSLNNEIWPAVAGLALESLKPDLSLVLNPRYPLNSYSDKYTPTTVPDGQLILATKTTAEKLRTLESLTPIGETKTLKIFWQKLPEQFNGEYPFEFISLFSLRNEGFSSRDYNHLGESFRWSSEDSSSIFLPLKQGRDYMLTLNMAVPQQIPEISIFVNEQHLTDFYFKKWEWHEYTVVIPQEQVRPLTKLTFRYNYTNFPIFPLEIGENGNSVAFKSITFSSPSF